MDRVVVQDLVLMGRVTAVAVLVLDSKVIRAIKAIRVATINSQVRGISSSNLGIRVTQSS
jgi:hypothetical protein